MSTPDLDTLSRLAQALGVPLREALPEAEGGAEGVSGAAIAADWARLGEDDRELVLGLVARLLRTGQQGA